MTEKKKRTVGKPPKKKAPSGATGKCESPIPIRMLGRHLRIAVEILDNKIKVLGTHVEQSPLVRSIVPSGGLVAQVVTKDKVLWIDTFPYDDLEQGISRRKILGHSERRPETGALVNLAVPITSNQMPDDIVIRLFRAEELLPGKIFELDALLATPQAICRQLKPIGKLTILEVAKHPGFLKVLQQCGLSMQKVAAQKKK